MLALAPITCPAVWRARGAQLYSGRPSDLKRARPLGRRSTQHCRPGESGLVKAGAARQAELAKASRRRRQAAGGRWRIREYRVLVTGFGPFPGVRFNPTAPLAERLATLRRPALAGVIRTSHVFPTTYAGVEKELPALLAEVRPDVILLFGLATRTPYLRIETRALNRRSALFPDAQGCHPATWTITPHAAIAVPGNAPHHRLVAAARRTNVPVRLSRNAGTYLCNFAYWRALELSARDGSLVQFIHVPPVRHDLGGVGHARSLTLDDLTETGTQMLMALLATARDRRLARERQD